MWLISLLLCFKYNTNARLNLDATSQATHAPQQSSLYNSCVQSGAQQYQFGSSALSQLTKLDARANATDAVLLQGIVAADCVKAVGREEKPAISRCSGIPVTNEI